MNARDLCLGLGFILAAAGAGRAQEAPAFRYDPAKNSVYLGEARRPAAPGAIPAELLKELAAVADEILDGPWAPLYSDYSAAQAGGVGPAEWAFHRPGDPLLALAQAAPYLGAAQKEKARAFLREALKLASPTREMYVRPGGKPRALRQAPDFKGPWVSAEDMQRHLFPEAYAVWAWASAFDAWDDAKPCFEDLKKIRAQLDSRQDFVPATRPGADGPLTAALAADPAYAFGVYAGLLSGFQDNYGYQGAREAQRRMADKKPVFFHVRLLAGLLGHYRLARHFGDAAERKAAEETFQKVAALALSQKSAPYLWSDPCLVPEIGRLLRDHAAPWLDTLARSPNSCVSQAREWDGKPVAGNMDKQVINPHTWYHAWGGQGEGVRPRTVLGAYLVHALLFQTPAEKLAEMRDIPWCKADPYYARKLVAAIEAAGKAGWVKLP